MKILVCIKHVPQKDATLKLNDAGTWIKEDISYEVNEPDAFALEEALRDFSDRAFCRGSGGDGYRHGQDRRGRAGIAPTRAARRV